MENPISMQKSTLCSHCGTPVPSSLIGAFREIVPEQDKEFCCSGCASVYTILQSCNLQEYYRLKQELDERQGVPAKVSGKDYSGYDDPIFLQRIARKLAGGYLEVELFVEGTHCIACAWLIEKILMEREGAISARLDLGRRIVTLVYNPQTHQLSAFAKALDRIGYPPYPISENTPTALRKSEHNLLIRIGIAGAGAGNIMLLAFALYSGEYGQIEEKFATLFRWISFGLALPVIFYSAFPFYKGAWLGIRNQIPTMDLPISLGIILSFIASTYATFQNRNEVYFDSTTMFVFLLLIGRYVNVRANRWATEAGVSLLDSMPKLVHVQTNHEIIDKPLDEVRVGDHLVVYANEVVPIDGIVLSNEGYISQASLTGESLPVRVQQNDPVFAGSMVFEKNLVIQTQAVGLNTRIAKLSDLMQKARLEKAPLAIVTDRIAHWFVLAVLFLTALTVFIWSFIEPQSALWHAVAMLVVTCPCALGIATPVAFAVAIGFYAKHGVFLKNPTALERLAKVNHLLLDKTGTLTHNELQIQEVIQLDSSFPIEKNELLKIVADMESTSVHPIGKALSKLKTQNHQFIELRHIVGKGVWGKVYHQQQDYELSIGSFEFVTEGMSIEQTKEIQKQYQSVVEPFIPVWVSVNKKLSLLILLGDTIRQDALSSVQKLVQLGYGLEIVSGDSHSAVARVAKELGITNFHSQVQPEDKLQLVLQRQSEGKKVLMFGDGVNDAAALAAADCGVSAAHSAEITRDAADVFLIREAIQLIVKLLESSRKTMKRIYFNLGVAFFYNLVGASLAITGNIRPLVAAILMPISSLTALFIASYRPKSW
ncbi:MAG: heavy metal translocating P-type ATPase [bacterium]|nr:heavy metal translocating P-type ATPase [bacterium]